MTKRPLRLVRTAATIGVASIALAACGGGGEEPAAEATASESSTSEAPAVEGDGTLTIGSLLPQTGSLAFLGPPEFAGVELAIDDINAAGGVNGTPVAYEASDSGDTTTDIASQSVQRLLAANTDVVIGAASSGVSFNVIDAITGAGAVHFSPANTSPDFTDYDDNGLYFRTAPSDVLQGRVMGDLLLQDGYLDVALITLDDPYGSGLAENITSTFEAGGGTIVTNEVFNPDAPTYSAEVSAIAAAQPEALVVISFEQAVQIVQELQAQGIGPDVLPTYFVDGNLADYSADFPPGTLAGVKGTLPGAETSPEFQARLLEKDPTLTGFPYSPESYDAAILVALAATVAGSDAGEAIAAELQGVSAEGTKCTEYTQCLELIEAGEDIDYDGFSGPIEFDENGDPTEATIGVYEYGEDNNYANVDYLAGTL